MFGHHFDCQGFYCPLARNGLLILGGTPVSVHHVLSFVRWRAEMGKLFFSHFTHNIENVRIRQ